MEIITTILNTDALHGNEEKKQTVLMIRFPYKLKDSMQLRAGFLQALKLKVT